MNKWGGARAVIDTTSLAKLEEELDIAKAEARSRRSSSRDLEAGRGSAGRDEIEASAADLLETSHRGVAIAAHVESRPLIPLFQASGIDMPPEIKVDHVQMGYDFYLAEVTFSILLDGDEQALSTEFEIRLSDDVADRARKTRPIRLFPGRKDVNLFRLEIEGAVGLDATLNLSVPHEEEAILPFAAAVAKARTSLDVKMVAGPYSFDFRKAAIEVKGESDPTIYWRYTLSSELAGKNDFKSILVLKVARETTRIEATATLAVVPFKRRWLLFKRLLPTLKQRVTLPIELAHPKPRA